jgi:hypothetical protein
MIRNGSMAISVGMKEGDPKKIVDTYAVSRVVRI